MGMYARRRHRVVRSVGDAALARLLEIVKNRSGKWCMSRRCGNQLAARKYRRSEWYRYLHSDEG